MDSQILFSEKQAFKQWWVWLILLGINGVSIYGVFKQVVGGEQFGDKPMGDTGLLITMGISLLIAFLFLYIRLETQIKYDGIYVRFFPFHLKFKYYSWDTLKKSYVREYSALAEYGGWGLRFGLFGKGAAFNVSGDKGLQLEFTNGNKLLVGTNKPEELTEVLYKTGQLKL
jgi:hypothetical protein